MPNAIRMRDAAVILAGGRATRFPGKLEHRVNGVPLVVRACRAFRDDFDTIVSCAKPFRPEIDAQLECPIVLDRWQCRGPLGGMLSTCEATTARRIFAVAADLPNVTAAVALELAEAWGGDCEAVVPEHAGGIEPLCALYDREALLREGRCVLQAGRGAVRAVLERLRVRRVPMNAEIFINVNTPSQLEALSHA